MLHEILLKIVTRIVLRLNGTSAGRCLTNSA